MKQLLVAFLFLVAVPVKAAITYANTPVRMHAPSTGPWTNPQGIEWRYTTSRPNAFYTACQDNTQTITAYLNLGDTSTHSADMCLPVTVWNVQYRFVGGSGTWTNASGGGQDWYVGPVPTPEANVCITNGGFTAGVWTLVVGTPPNQTIESATLLPGEYWCVQSEEAFILKIDEIIATIEGPPATNSTPIFSWNPSAGTTNAGGTVNPPPNPVNTSGGITSNPTNDAQRVGNGIVGQLQNNQQQDNLNANRIAGLLEQIRDKVATNATVDETLTNRANDALGAGNSVSNMVGGQLGQTGDMQGALDGMGGGVSVASPFAVDLSAGVEGLASLQFDIMEMPQVVGLRNWVWRLFLYTTKLVCIAFAFRHMLKTFADFGNAMKGNGTSGFLQAAVISLPQLAASLRGMTLRWQIAAGIIPVVFGLVVTGVTQIDAYSDMPTSLSDLAPSSGSLAYGWALVTYFIPLELMFRCFMVTASGCVLITLTVVGATIITDATSKA